MRQHCWFHLWWWNILCDQLASITLSRPPDFCSQSFFCLYDSLVFFACQADNSLTKKLGYNSIFLVKILWPMKVNSLHKGNYGWGAYSYSFLWLGIFWLLATVDLEPKPIQSLWSSMQLEQCARLPHVHIHHFSLRYLCQVGEGIHFILSW